MATDEGLARLSRAEGERFMSAILAVEDGRTPAVEARKVTSDPSKRADVEYHLERHALRGDLVDGVVIAERVGERLAEAFVDQSPDGVDS